MTGFGSAMIETNDLRAAVNARSLNHRFLDVTVHLPRRLQSLEGEIKASVSRIVRRGRVEVSVQATLPSVPTEEVVPARPLVASMVRALRELQDEFDLEGGIAVSDLLRIPGALERAELSANPPPQTRTALLDLVTRALEGLDEMRQAEGQRLTAELERALDAIEASSGRIEERAEETREPRQSALLERVQALVSEIGLEDGRLYQEVVRAVERHDVAEEVQRLRSHATMARELLAGGDGPAGKQLDFLAQELIREANTVGSKVADADQVQAVVGLKAEIERLREQVQNVE
jgi:uncharacterized protein (TIGR00255 family)